MYTYYKKQPAKVINTVNVIFIRSLQTLHMQMKFIRAMIL